MSSSDNLPESAMKSSTQSDCKTAISTNDQPAMDSPEPSHNTDKVERHVRFAIPEDPNEKPSEKKKLKKSRKPTETRHPSEYKPPKPHYVAWDVGVVALERLKQKIPNHKRIRVLQNVATKDLSEHTFAPYLGLDTTLPQHRPSTPKILPAQREHSVYYFLYEEFADRENLSKIIRRKVRKEKLMSAVVEHGALTWGENDLVLVDSYGSQEQGKAIHIRDQQEEDLLRAHMGSNYEVVRCTLHMKSARGRAKTVGLTFRYKQEPWQRLLRLQDEIREREKKKQKLWEKSWKRAMGEVVEESEDDVKDDGSSDDDDLPEWSIFTC